jgi:precorrin-2 methylase
MWSSTLPSSFSFAICTMSVRVSFITPGRPTLTPGYVHLEAIKRRYQAMMVSGVTIVATLLSSLCPNGLPLAARRRR